MTSKSSDESSQSLKDTYSLSRRASHSSGPSGDSSDDDFPLSSRTLVVVIIGAALVSAVATAGGLMAVASGPSDNTVVSTTAPSSNTPVVVNGSSGASSGYSTLYNETIKSTVSVYAMNNESGPGSQGSGFVYDKQGRIITNHHVVKNGETFYIQFSDGEWSKATLVGSDPYTDLAVLKVKDKPDYAVPLPLSKTLPHEGAKAFVIGSPTGLRGSITSGLVSGTERSMQTRAGFSIPDMIQTDAALNPGNSGGPLVNREGEVIGVNRARQGENIGFAISARMTDKIAKSLIEDGKHEHPLVGIRTVGLSPRIAQANNLSSTNGVLVTEVMGDSPADGNLQGANGTTVKMYGDELPLGGDVIVALDGHEIANNEELASYLMLHKSPGEEVTVTVLRDGERVNETFELGKRPPFGGAP